MEIISIWGVQKNLAGIELVPMPLVMKNRIVAVVYQKPVA